MREARNIEKEVILIPNTKNNKNTQNGLEFQK
jgi:hypothetical protein